MEQEAEVAFNELMKAAEELKSVTEIDQLTDIMQYLYSDYILPEKIKT